jgi:UDP-N-acetylmuramoyl-L-alanyl-D-glutamate--2,6-diaminopimelate ligase
VQPGALFVAVWHPGYAADRHQFAGAAVRAGAAAVVAQRPVDVPPGTPVVLVPETPRALGWLAAAFHGFPSARLGLAGVTGTDGKTTTCTMAMAILEAAGYRTGMVTTVASKTAGALREKLEHTSTPEAVEVQALLAETVAGGGRRAVVEATSHALDQDRLAGCEFDVAVVTRVTHEHLEYHGTYENYLAAKARLLDLLRPDPRHPKAERVPKAAILNVDDGSYDYLAARSPVPVIRYGVARDADVRALDLQTAGWTAACRVVSPWGTGALRLQVPGAFNVYNALGALAAACTLGAPFTVALDALHAFRGVPGRMERIDCGQPFQVIVDFAHTPDSLTQVLDFLRPLTPGRLIVVFGSAGERDRTKRPWMGRIAAERADHFILTDEDPRLEDRHQIIAEIAQGALDAGAVEGRQFTRIPDRRQAIAAALAQARPGDTVLLAGKGHEKSIIGALDGRLHSIPWDEASVAREELRRLGYDAPASPAVPDSATG